MFAALTNVRCMRERPLQGPYEHFRGEDPIPFSQGQVHDGGGACSAQLGTVLSFTTPISIRGSRLTNQSDGR